MKKLLPILLLLTSVAFGQAGGGTCPKNSFRDAISITGTGDATVVAADTNREIWVWQWFVVNGHATQDVNLTLKEGATSTSGAYLLVHLGGAHQAPCTGLPWARVPVGSAFIMNTSASGTLKGTVYYTLVQP